ncbi:MAG: hypothetical protein EA397_02335 [Deltaproteobacteria bacterium]|nr:MAG: hypothetical protein EA397_02335 [Deltaproteobacteria bacterium]
MTQSADVRPEPSLQRKAAIAHGAPLDHAGAVQIRPIPDFDLNQTIFKTLEGRLPRAIMKRRVGKHVAWKDDATHDVQAAYERATSELELPPIAPELMRFLVEECDFDVEHADGSFLDHLYFCYEYSALHYPQRSPLVMLLHSILGTGTNTFAMPAQKIPNLRDLLDPFDFEHTQAFPSVLRLLYAGELREELRANAHRADALRSLSMHRVIDDAPIELTGENIWISLNYQLIHLVDFMPVANWARHRNDTSFILFRDLYAILQTCGKLEAKVGYDASKAPAPIQGETLDMTGWLATKVPVRVSERMAAKSVRRFSEQIGHSLGYELTWD